MIRIGRTLRAAVPWCLLAGCLGLLAASQARWGPLGTPGLVLPAPTPGYEQAWHPYREEDANGVWSVCISSASGRPLPPYISPDLPTPAPALVSNPPSVGGSL